MFWGAKIIDAKDSPSIEQSKFSAVFLDRKLATLLHLWTTVFDTCFLRMEMLVYHVMFFCCFFSKDPNAMFLFEIGIFKGVCATVHTWIPSIWVQTRPCGYGRKSPPIPEIFRKKNISGTDVHMGTNVSGTDVHMGTNVSGTDVHMGTNVLGTDVHTRTNNSRS